MPGCGVDGSKAAGKAAARDSVGHGVRAVDKTPRATGQENLGLKPRHDALGDQPFRGACGMTPLARLVGAACLGKTLA